KGRQGSSARGADASVSESLSQQDAPPPQLLYLPDGGDQAIGSEFIPGPGPNEKAAEGAVGRRCPPEMVDIGGAFCIDRYEASLVDQNSGEEFSPYYPPDPNRARQLRALWERERARSGVARGREMELPELPDWQLEQGVEPVAVSRPQVAPQGYLDANTAQRACERAGKRLCTATEWVTACRGQQNRQYPYGSQYMQGACNIFRDAHPAAVLHGNASEGHLDPRLNRVEADGGPLLRSTGATPSCKSEWGADAVYDMVGNLDEWVEDENGAFHGGFYSRATRLGCDARISTHPRQYSDYSLGTRCCK
ncbi:MAG TPA: SUMF1/EgtB/PvdO family nonheme iron enzyme, partial [Polyangiaceae bacterium]|nr:SUMF1/EgtB/PvdO family nonheme iron enzyme [Polyangiaceae bacterium]